MNSDNEEETIRATEPKENLVETDTTFDTDGKNKDEDGEIDKKRGRTNSFPNKPRDQKFSHRGNFGKYRNTPQPPAPFIPLAPNGVPLLGLVPNPLMHGAMRGSLPQGMPFVNPFQPHMRPGMWPNQFGFGQFTHDNGEIAPIAKLTKEDLELLHSSSDEDEGVIPPKKKSPPIRVIRRIPRTKEDRTEEFREDPRHYDKRRRVDMPKDPYPPRDRDEERYRHERERELREREREFHRGPPPGHHDPRRGEREFRDREEYRRFKEQERRSYEHRDPRERMERPDRLERSERMERAEREAYGRPPPDGRSLEMREPRDGRNGRDPREVREPRDPRDAREVRDPRDGREARDARYRRSPPRHKDLPPNAEKLTREPSREELESSRILVLSNLAPTTTRSTIETEFAPFGTIENIRLNGTRAILTYRDVSCAVAAKRKFHKNFLNGNKIYVDFEI